MNSDDRTARVAGLLYLLFIPTAGLAFGFGQFLLAGDAATVFANIESHRRFFEFAIVLGTSDPSGRCSTHTTRPRGSRASWV